MSKNQENRRHTLLRTLGAFVVVLLMAFSVRAQDETTEISEGQSATTEALDIGKLPWSDQQEQIGDLPARRLTHARELLSLLSIDESQLAAFEDGSPLGMQDEETVRRILYRIPRFPLNDLHRWAKSTDKLDAVIAAPSEHRADTFLLRGRTTSIERIELLPEALERLEFDHYYRVRVDLDDSPHDAVLCCRDIPTAWTSSKLLDQPIVAYGLFLKLGETHDAESELAFATPHIGWLPLQPDVSSGITTDLAHLASLGMDVSLFDDVRHSNRKPITQTDRECFYQLLATLGKADPNLIRSYSRASVDLAPLLQDPST
ncbi:MAG TPA: hypothetical protein P5307_19690, partial [Pirellulaceae bacterium]|nr:hypothetical protein [Pirellulaceae bacterium]